MPNPDHDRAVRTTPRWARIPALLLLLSLSGYFSVCYAVALEDEKPRWASRHPHLMWFGRWQMFTLLDRRTSLVRAEAWLDGKPYDVDLEGLFPYRWDSGPRYARSAFWKSGYLMRILGDSTCLRLEQTEGRQPDRLRFELVQFRKRLGRSGMPKDERDIKRTELAKWECGRKANRPQGRVL
jgi:hypothetical protein